MDGLDMGNKYCNIMTYIQFMLIYFYCFNKSNQLCQKKSTNLKMMELVKWSRKRENNNIMVPTVIEELRMVKRAAN